MFVCCLYGCCWVLYFFFPARFGPVPQQYMNGPPPQQGRGYMVANGRVMGQQMAMNPPMNMMQNQRVMPRGLFMTYLLPECIWVLLFGE